MGRNVASEVFNPGVVGTYTVHVVVTDSAGASASCDTHVTAMSHGIRVELLWDGPGDVDLHVHNGVTTSPWFTTPNDCYYANPDATWGAVLDLDSIDGPGPELTHIDTPVSGMTYTMAAHAYSMTSAGRTATMRVYCGRTTTPAIVRTSHPFVAPSSGNSSANDFWRAASITWNAAPPCTATPIDTYTTSMSASTTF